MSKTTDIQVTSSTTTTKSNQKPNDSTTSSNVLNTSNLDFDKLGKKLRSKILEKVSEKLAKMDTSSLPHVDVIIENIAESIASIFVDLIVFPEKTKEQIKEINREKIDKKIIDFDANMSEFAENIGKLVNTTMIP